MKRIMIVSACLFAFVSLKAQTGTVVRKDKGLYMEMKDSVKTIRSKEIGKHKGETIRICDKVTQVKYDEVPKEAPSELLIGGYYPNHLWTLVIPKDVQHSNFRFDPEKKMDNKRFCLVGKVESYKGKPAIVIHDERAINEED